MDDSLRFFEQVVRRSYRYTESVTETEKQQVHPFEERNVHPEIANVVLGLFDNAHYAQATFEAYKLIDQKVKKAASEDETGVKLMMKAFNEDHPQINLTPITNVSERDEQEGYKFLFAGSIKAIRNPRGHETGLKDSPEECLDYLALASMLLRRLEKAVAV